MAKQTINLGTSANKGDGDPLRTAFDKINDNFTEVYGLLGADEVDTDDVIAPMLVHNNHINVVVTRDDDADQIIFTVDQAVTDLQGSVYGDDSTLLVDGVNSSINLDGTVKGDIIPDTDVAYDLGSAAKRFRDIYLSGSTIDLGGLEISNVGGELQLGGVKIITQSELDVAVQNDITTNLTGSVFADDSTLLVDGVAGKIVGDVENNIVYTDVVYARNSDLYVNADDQASLYLGATNSQTIIIGASDSTIYLNGNQDSLIGAGKFFSPRGTDLNIATLDMTSGSADDVIIKGGETEDSDNSAFGGNVKINAGRNSNALQQHGDIQIGTEFTNGVTIGTYDGGDGFGNTVSLAGYTVIVGNSNNLSNIQLKGNVDFSDAKVSNLDVELSGDLTGSVFADDSTVLVDGVNGSIPWSVISDVDLDALVAGEDIPDLLTAYTDASLAMDSLLNAGDYGGDLVAPSDYTFYDLVVARRAVDPLIPQELELAALLQLNAYNAWQDEIAADKATITVGDYAWNFKGDGNIDGLFEGTGPVSFNNDYFEDGFRGGFTTDKSILQIMGADYVGGSDDGGGIIIAGGSARNGGNRGDVTIATGAGGAEGTGIIALLGDYITASGTWIGTNTMDIKGSVFGDDSTLLVDGVNGVIPTSVLQGDISNDIKSSDIVIETTTSPGSISLTQTGIGNISISGTAIDFNNSPIQNFILSTLSSGLTAPGSAVVAGETAINFNFSGVGTKLTVEQDAITIGSGVTVSGFVGDITGDLTGSVFGDDSTTIVDGINANVTANILTSNTASNFNGTLSVVGVTRLYDDLIIDGGDIVSDNSAYFFGNLECSNITNLQNNAFASDNLTLSAEGSIVLNGNVSLGTVAGRSDFYGEIEFNSGTTLFQGANSVEFNCPVDFSNATVDWQPYVSDVIINNGLPVGTRFTQPAPTTSKGSSGDALGTVAFDSNYIYYCTAHYTNGVADIWKRVAWSGDTW